MTIEELQILVNAKSLDSSSPTLLTAARWIQDHVVEVAWKTVDDVAQETGVSPASVIRTCRSLGFDGFSSLQRLVRESLPAAEHLVEKLSDADLSSAVHGVIDRERHNLERFDESTIVQVGDLATTLLSARRIAVMASLTSTALGSYVAAHLNFLLGNVTFYEAESSASWIFLRDAGPEDAVLILSFPRYSTSARNMIQRCRERIPHTILVTDRVGKSLFSGIPALGLPVSGDLFSAGPPTAVFVQMLAHELRNRAPGRIVERLKQMDAVLTQAGVFLKDARSQIRD